MPTRRQFILGITAAGALAAIATPSFAEDITARKATAITKVYGDGLRFVAVAVAYSGSISAKDLSADGFSVPGRTITAVFPSNSADPADRASEGNFVIVELSPDDEDAKLLVEPPRQQPKDGEQGGPGGPGGGPGKVGDAAVTDKTWKTPEATVDLPTFMTANGDTVDAAKVETSAVENLVVDDFQQLEYKDETTGDTLAYNLYVPKNYDPSKSYPLVNFMHDAGTTSDDPLMTLKQGLGAICWASPEDQEKRPCFVLAPQYAEIIVDDSSDTSSMLDTTINLIKSLTEKYSIDKDRLYTTGQSGGGMMSIAMNIKYPDFFAASFLVACQWDPSLVAPMAGNRLFILVSQDDNKAFPGQNEITEALENEGAVISRAVWDGTWSAEQFRFAFDDLDSEGSRINYVTFAAGTVIPPGESTAGAAGHTNTWRIAYTIEPIREWIFREGE